MRLSSDGVAAAPVGPGRRDGPRFSCRLPADQQHVLRAVADGQVSRGYLLGDLEPYLLGDREVVGVLRRLVLRGLVLLGPVGPPRLTTRGRRLLEQPD